MDQVGLCNAALGLVSANPITSIDEASAGARLCKAHWPLVRDSVLERKQWTFAVRREQLAPEDGAPAFGFPYSYAIPTDAISVLTVRRPEDGPVDWVREGRKILAESGDGLDVRLLVRVDDTSLWSPGFQTAFIHLLASRIANALSEDKSEAHRQFQLYERALQLGGTMDGKQGTAEAIRPPDWLTASRF